MFFHPYVKYGSKASYCRKMVKGGIQGSPQSKQSKNRLHHRALRKERNREPQTAENIIERLASKAARKIYTDKTDRIYNKLVGDAQGRKALDIATGVRKADLEPKNVMVTMILFREKEADPKAEQQKEKQAWEIQENVDFEVPR